MPLGLHEFQKSIYLKLTGDATLMGLVTGVYDHVPQGAAFPYITLGNIGSRDWSTKTVLGTEYQFELHIYSQQGGRKLPAQIMERLHALLHNGAFSITGQTLISMRYEQGEVQLEKDGITYRGMMQFRSLTET